VMKRASKIICLSEYQAQLITRVYPEILERIRVIPPTEPHIVSSEHRARRAHKQTHPLHVIIPGNFAKQKGADIAILVMLHFKNSPEISFTIPSRVDLEYEKIIDLAGLNYASNVQFIRGYPASQSRLSIYDGIDVALSLSIWPEAGIPMTLYESKQAGVPSIVTNLGQRAQEIQQGVNGWKVPPHDASAVISILKDIIRDPQILDSVRANITTDSTADRGYHEQLLSLFEGILDKQTVEEKSRIQGAHLRDSRREEDELVSAEQRWDTPLNVSHASEHRTLVSKGIPSPRQAIRRFRYYRKNRAYTRR